MPYIGNQHNVGDHVNNFKVLDDISSYTATFDGSATSVVSTTAETIRIPEHRFIQGQRVTYNNGGGSNIGGLTSGTAYYVSFDSANTVKLATSLANANTNTVINLSTVGGGTSHTLNAAFDGVNTKFKLTFGSGSPARLNNATQINVAINNVIQRPNLDPNNFTDGFALADNHKIVFKTAPTSQDIFWGSIIANTIENFDLRDNEVDNFTGNGSATEFTLSTIPANNESVIVTIDGVLQHPSDKDTTRAYTLIDSILQFTTAPALNAEIQARHIGFAGASTADVSGFYGRTGNVVLGSTDHITTGDITARNINASGILTAASASFGGNVSIGGTLTYEDVTNIDSVGIVTAREGIFLPDNKKLELGNAAGSGDLQLYHDGGHSRIVDNGTGNLVVQTDGFRVRSTDETEVLMMASKNNSVDLYYDNDKKFETSAKGIQVGTGVTFETNGQGTFSGIVTSRGYEVSYSDSGPTHNLFKAGRIRIFDNGSHCHFRFGDHPSYAPHQHYSSNYVQRTNAWYLQNTAATRYGITWNNTDGPVHLYYSKGYAPDYSIKLSTHSSGINVTGVTTTRDLAVTGVSTFSGDIVIADSIVHTGDTDTKIRFPAADTFSVETGGTQGVRLTSAQKLLVGDHTVSRSIGNSEHILQTEGTSASENGISLYSFTNNQHAAHLSFGKSRNNTSIADDDYLGHIIWCAHDGTDVNSTAARITASIDGTPGSNDTPGRLEFYTTSDGSQVPTERARITSNGKILIGSDTLRNVGGSSASGQLQVEGTTANTSSVLLINNQANNNSPVLSFGKTRGTNPGAVTAVADGDILGSIKFSGADGTDLANSTANIKAIVNGTVATDQIPSDLVFETSATNSGNRTERFRITSVGDVGIGVTNPESDLHVKGNLLVQNTIGNNLTVRSTVSNGNDSTFRLEKARGGATATIVQDNDDLGMINWAGYDGSDYEVGAHIYAEVEGTPGSGDMPTRMILATRSSGAGSALGRFTIGANGVKQIVNGNLNISSTYIDFSGDVSTPSTAAAIYRPADNTLAFSTANTERLRIDSSGRLGLNQSTPVSRLHISEAGSNTITIQLTNATTGHTAGTDGMTMGYSTNSTAGFINVCESGSDFTIKTGGTAAANERLRITSSGNVGINSTSPAATLDIHDIGSTGPCLLLRGGSSTEGDIVVPHDEALAFGHWNYSSNTFTERLRIDSAGDVFPGADNDQDLGTSSKRWANVYSADLQLSNKGKTNNVDGTWGDFTIQEGESDLFLINNRNGKKYKFNLTEVS